MSSSLTRREFLALAAGVGTLGAAGALGGCTFGEPLLRIGAHPWPGYELFYLAREKHWVDPKAVRLVEMPSASDSIQALFAGSLEGAALTLDEVLSVRADGLDLKVVTVLDISLGADVLLARPEIRSLQDLRGRRVGVENSATGAVMLEGALETAGLTSRDVIPVYMTIDLHRTAYMDRKVDALVTYEPQKSQLMSVGARVLFDSSRIPGRIVDVLAVQPQILGDCRAALRQLVAGHFRALKEFSKDPAAVAAQLAPRLQLPPAQVPQAYAGLELPDLSANRQWLGSSHPRIESAALQLQDIMRRNGLLSTAPGNISLADPQFLPGD